MILRVGCGVIRATFATRAEADLAVEHLVQQHGIARPDIFIQSTTADNDFFSSLRNER
jgi:hypothetical protein